MARVRLNLNYESLSNEKAVAHVIKAVICQEVATPSDQVQPVNAIAQPMAVLDGEVPVAEAVAVAGEVVPMSHMEGAVRVVSESFSRRGTRGCSLGLPRVGGAGCPPPHGRFGISARKGGLREKNAARNSGQIRPH